MEEKNLSQIAALFLNHCLDIKEGSRILILTDDEVTGSDELGKMRDAIVEIMRQRDLDPSIVCFPARTKMGSEIPAVALAACMESDILLSFNTSLILYAGNFSRIYQGGTTSRELAMFPAGNSIKKETNYFERMMPDSEEEIMKVAGMTKKYAEILGGGKEHTVHLMAENGTDLNLRVGKLSGSAHAGICEPGTMELIPAGILSLGVSEGSAEGTLVVDYSTSLKKKTLKEKICFEVHDGSAVSVTGGAEADEFLEAAKKVQKPDREKFHISEFGLGFNPRAKADGQVTDGENILGAAHIGIGSNALFGGKFHIPEWHIDGIIPNATVEADGELILKDGKYREA